uniref:G2/mitotic-specific cyclin-B3 n=1 Tax=Daphnia galeata TaxID=27404 RepID=A0A8J2RB28_9CRUS|nr:unnamed protein product [Daphnia galeata]
MAPTKPSGITQMVTRMRAAANPKATVNPSKAVVENNSLLNKKRKAETVLTSENKKRSALGDLTNANSKLQDAKKAAKAAKLTSTSSSTNLARPQLARPSTKALTLNLVKEDVKVPDQIDSEATIYFSPENAKPKRKLPPNVEDFDSECGTDPFQTPQYAQDIFLYFKQRELKFIPRRYMDQQTELTCDMRAVLVDWLVEVQESFELNHETLYSAVRLVDLYLSHTTVIKENLQLVGTTAMLISSKFEERCPPCVDDFLYICDDAYTRRDLIKMEMSILKAVDFDIGLPLSYSFLRRYARVSKASMETLTLARFILETSLMEYDLINVKDSLMAASALMMAFQMQNSGDWTPTLEYYSSFTKAELRETTQRLHAMLIKLQSKNLKTIRNKYSHKVFYEVAKIALPAEMEF